ncbi:unnamed protein product [Darwinula stevensoni]|uniref:RNA helicase aquarius n=1 Tax=Darwinula stevensoni TaxID=69355 RepID=A0A7R9A3G3_9CRUS|nr:unnamed protein product [Darwinula stevensoni]CAG0881256.1 unnamed protein product [Darwinula stevensoni]
MVATKVPHKPRQGAAPTVDQIFSDRITQVAYKYWSPQTKGNHSPFNADIIEEVYQNEIIGSSFSRRRIMMLEFSQYLENYLWPNFTAERSSKAYLVSIAVMVNEKFRERVPAWKAFEQSTGSGEFGVYFGRLLRALYPESEEKDEGNAGLPLTLREETELLSFLTNCAGSLEEEMVRTQIQRLVSLPCWISVSERRREAEMKAIPRWRKYWRVIQKKDSKESEETRKNLHFERTFLRNMIRTFLLRLEHIPLEGDIENGLVSYLTRFLDLLIVLEWQLPTRRFFTLVLDDSHLLVKCKRSAFLKRQEGKLFTQLLEMLSFYMRFEINEETGDPLDEQDVMKNHYDQITSLQRAAFLKFPELRKFSLSNVASVDTRVALEKHFKDLPKEKLHEIAAFLNLVPPLEESQEEFDKDFLLQLLIFCHEKRPSQVEELNSLPLYPTEEVIWDEHLVPPEGIIDAYASGHSGLALPRLGLQFLTFKDYLLRNFTLFRLESTYEIRQDVEDVLFRLKPWKSETGKVVFGGWARMGNPIDNFSIVEVGRPLLGEKVPSRVRADVTLQLSTRPYIKSEWESLRKHDVCFLLTVRPSAPIGTKYTWDQTASQQTGLTYVRGCEIEGMLDSHGRVIEEGPNPKPELQGDSRTLRVWLDANQYHSDMERAASGNEDVYETFNILMRRKPKENNFKAVLETIRDLINGECIVPDWLHDIILGYGDPAAAQFCNMPNEMAKLDFKDTFLNMEHLRGSFPSHEVQSKCNDPEKLVPPLMLTFLEVEEKRKVGESIKGNSDGEKKVIIVEPYVIPSRGPYPYVQPKKNSVPFTPTQVQAIRAGMQPGLTLVVGPPGSGKTDVAVQIISNIYHNFPDQRILIVTHSNQALNQLFEKIMALDIDERHLLRLGHGEEALETEKDFSRYGRVNYVLAKRLDLLQEVQRLQESLEVPGDVAYTCETAGYFYINHVLSRWEKFLTSVQPVGGKAVPVEAVKQLFPFEKFFENAPQPLFQGTNYDEDMERARGCFQYIRRIFTQLEEFRAFELLRSGLDRSRYLLVKEAKIIAMTCTHAALKRRELLQFDFQYDSLVMEEAAQILEIETFIPLLLQAPKDGFSRLKRWIMIGDHHQLPPVVQNPAFQKLCNMEQSLFARLVHLGVPTVDLDAQGRARSSYATFPSCLEAIACSNCHDSEFVFSLCELYKWRYKKLDDLPHVANSPEFQVANPGFCFDCQVIDVGDFQGVGESTPSPYFYQNLAEAEYVVGVFMYMRLLGYPAEKISILTTYNGQKHLLRDVVTARCANNPVFGRPHKIATVDKYQGQQNDFILLSLVRTRTVGHLRDVRRLIVALSRARLGLYIFARVELFSNCFELMPAFNILLKHPTTLHLAPWETYPSQRPGNTPPAGEPVIIEEMPQMLGFVVHMYEQQMKAFEAMAPIQEKTEMKEFETPDKVMRSHPGAESDSEGEEEAEDKPGKRKREESFIQDSPMEEGEEKEEELKKAKAGSPPPTPL